MPTTTGKATEFIQFTRASNATVTDSDGKVKWAPHNLLTNSESFDASGWVKTNVTATANTIAAPNGATTADQLFETTASGVHNQGQSVSSPAGQYTFAVYVKPAGRDFVGLYNAETAVGKIFDVSSGTVGSDMTAAPVSASITAVGGGWYRCEIVVNTSLTTTNWRVYTCNSSSTFSYVGDITKGLYLWGAHLYRSDLAMQANTSAYPMYNPTTPKNLLGYTEDFSNAAWTKSQATIEANQIVAPNGLQTADFLKEDSTNNPHRIFLASAITLVSGTKYTYTVYAKAGARSQFFMRVAGGTTDANGAVFDLTAQTATAVGTIVSASISSVGDGWFRCSLVSSAVTTSVNGYIGLYSGGSTTYQGDGSSGLYIWGAQISDSASLDSYVPTYGAAVTSAAYYGPRRDFDSAGVCKGLLVEEQRTNLLLQSGDFSSASWTKSNCTFATGVITTTSAVDGLSQAITNYGSNATHSFTWRVSSGTATWLRVVVYQTATTANRVSAWFNVATGTSGSATNGGTGSGSLLSVKTISSGVYDITLTGAVNNSATAVTVQISTATADNSTTGVSGVTYGVQFAQLEAGSFATSYIPTGAATATRNGDVASVSTQAFPYSSTEGTVVVNVNVPIPSATTTRIVAVLRDGTLSANQQLLYWYASSLGAQTAAGGVSQADVLMAITPGVNAKSAYAFKENDFQFCRDGTLATADTSGAMPTGINTMHIGSVNGASPLCGHIRQITYLPRRISNTELQSRTA